MQPDTAGYYPAGFVSPGEIRSSRVLLLLLGKRAVFRKLQLSNRQLVCGSWERCRAEERVHSDRLYAHRYPPAWCTKLDFAFVNISNYIMCINSASNLP